MKRIILTIAASITGSVNAVPALAHAFLDHALPAVGAVVASPPSEIKAFFSESVEPRFSGLSLATAGGRPVQAAPARVDPANPQELVLAVPPLAPGEYRVTWHVVSSDTHRTEGSFSFEIKP